MLIPFILMASLMTPDLSSLVAAARSGDVSAIHHLVAAGADPNAPSGENGWTPLLHAIHKAQPGAVSALLDAGADVNRDVNGVTPLMMAAGYGYLDIVRVLLRHGANSRARDRNGETALDWAVAGTTDIDRFTFFRCQDDTVRALVSVPGAPRAVRARTRRWGSIKRCDSMSLINTR